MLRYIIKRIIFAIPVLIGATFLVFTIMDLAPGDPALLSWAAMPQKQPWPP